MKDDASKPKAQRKIKIAVDSGQTSSCAPSPLKQFSFSGTFKREESCLYVKYQSPKRETSENPKAGVTVWAKLQWVELGAEGLQQDCIQICMAGNASSLLFWNSQETQDAHQLCV